MAKQNPDGENFFDCRGPKSAYVMLVSSEKETFFLKREYAIESPVMNTMLSGHEQYAETRTNKITFPGIRSLILIEVCKYLKLNAGYSGGTQGIPTFDINPEIALELLMAANHFQC